MDLRNKITKLLDLNPKIFKLPLISLKVSYRESRETIFSV
jgi:hypothetical protein